MKNNIVLSITILLTFCISLFCTINAYKELHEPLRIMTFCIPTTFTEIFFVTFQKPKEKKRFKVAKNMIREYQPDILGFQKLQESDIEKFLEKFDGYKQATTAHLNAIFFRTDKLTLEEQGEIWLNESQKPNTSDWGARKARQCAWAKLYVHETNKSLWIFNTQLDDHSQQAQIKGAALIAQAIKEHNDPAILMGNFNAIDQAKAVRQLFESPWLMTHTKNVAKELTGPRSTLINWNLPVDHIIINNPELFTVSRYSVIDFIQDGIRPSNHRPVMIDVQLH